MSRINPEEAQLTLSELQRKYLYFELESAELFFKYQIQIACYVYLHVPDVNINYRGCHKIRVRWYMETEKDLHIFPYDREGYTYGYYSTE